MKRLKAHLLTLSQTASAFALVLAPLPALAADNEQDKAIAVAAAADVAAGADVAVDEAEAALADSITVYARRRGERVSDVPLAVSVVGGDRVLESAQINTTNDIVQFVPNAHAAQPHGPSRARWFIRGIGTNNTGNNTINPVGIYYDDVYIANINNQGYPLFDIDRVEVLNGPQGTLWGKNSNGGAINFVSKAPSFDLGGYAQLSYGSDSEKEVQGAVTGPLTSDVAGRLSFYYRDFDGWQKNLITGGKHGGGEEVATRAQVLYQPSDTLSVLFNVHTRNNSNQNFGASFAASQVSPLTSATATQRAFLSVYPTGLPLNGWGETTTVNQEPEELDAAGWNVKANWDLGWAKLISITAYEENALTSREGSNPIPTTSPFYNNGRPFSLSYTLSKSRQTSQEFRLTSPDTGRLTWLAGLYGFTGRLSTRNVVANYVRGASTGTANAWGTSPQFTDTNYNQATDNYAIFGSLGYKFTDRFSVSGGVRWSHEKTSIDWIFGAANTAGAAASFIPDLPTSQFWLYRGRDLTYTDSDSQKTSAWTYDITPEYKISEEIKAYFRFAHGVLPGGYTNTGYVPIPGTTTRANQIFALNPEKIDAYEAGLKTIWFDGKLSADLAAFYYDYTNLVVNVPTVLDPANPSVATVLFRNAGAAEIKGLELRFNATPIQGLSLFGSFGYLDTEYTEDTGNTATILGAQAPRSPHYTANLSVDYNQPLPNGASIDFGVDGRYSSKFFFYPTVASQITAFDPVLAQKGYAVFNGRIRYNFDEDRRLAAQISVLNITDQKYKTHSLPVSNGASNQMYGRPRSVLVSLLAQF